MIAVIVSRARSLMPMALDRALPESERAERISEILSMLTGIGDN